VQESEIKQFKQHVNSRDENLQFKVESEQNSSTLVFLNSVLLFCVCLKDDGSTEVKTTILEIQQGHLAPVSKNTCLVQ